MSERTVYDEVRAERERAHAKHGDKSMEAWPAGSYKRLAILSEEVGEVAREFNEAELRGGEVDALALRAELIQVAAMAAAWADALDRDLALATRATNDTDPAAVRSQITSDEESSE